MRKLVASVVACLSVYSAASVLSSASIANADLSWPRPIVYTKIRGPEPILAVNIWCVYRRSGSYGNAYFTQTESFVNYGGNCNAAWGRPAWHLNARAVSYNLYNNVIRQDYRVSGSNWWAVQATIPFVDDDGNNPGSGAFNYLAKSGSYNPTTNVWSYSSHWENP